MYLWLSVNNLVLQTLLTPFCSRVLEWEQRMQETYKIKPKVLGHNSSVGNKLLQTVA